MPAMVGPVCIYHPDLGNGGVAVFLVLEIGLAELDVIEIHSKTELVDHSFEIILCRINESVNS